MGSIESHHNANDAPDKCLSRCGQLLGGAKKNVWEAIPGAGQLRYGLRSRSALSRAQNQYIHAGYQS
jgi:hypothetical protein